MLTHHWACALRPGLPALILQFRTSFIFLFVGTGIVLTLFYIYPTVPHAPAFLHSFLLLATVVKGIDPKLLYISTPCWYLNFLLLFSIYPMNWILNHRIVFLLPVKGRCWYAISIFAVDWRRFVDSSLSLSVSIFDNDRSGFDDLNVTVPRSALGAANRHSLR